MHDPKRRKPIKCMRNTLQADSVEFTREQEIAVVERYLVNKDPTLAGHIVKNNIAAIKRLALRYLVLARASEIFKELVGVGALGLITALNTLEFSPKTDLMVYADPYVRRSILREIHRFNATRATRNVCKVLFSITFVKVCNNCRRKCVY